MQYNVLLPETTSPEVEVSLPEASSPEVEVSLPKASSPEASSPETSSLETSSLISFTLSECGGSSPIPCCRRHRCLAARTRAATRALVGDVVAGSVSARAPCWLLAYEFAPRARTATTTSARRRIAKCGYSEKGNNTASSTGTHNVQ